MNKSIINIYKAYASGHKLYQQRGEPPYDNVSKIYTDGERLVEYIYKRSVREWNSITQAERDASATALKAYARFEIHNDGTTLTFKCYSKKDDKTTLAILKPQ